MEKIEISLADTLKRLDKPFILSCGVRRMYWNDNGEWVVRTQKRNAIVYQGIDFEKALQILEAG